MSQILITAHRGSSQEAPENTLAAIELAIAQKADYVELDVQQTRDHHLVICHDLNLKRLAGVDVNLYELTLEELLGLEVGSWLSEEFAGEKIPTLWEVLELTTGKIKLNLELKLHGYESELAQGLVAVLGSNFAGVISSFDYPTLMSVTKLDQSLKIGLIMAKEVANLSQKEVNFYSVAKHLATANFIAQAHQLDRPVHVWTVNEVDEIEEMIDKGVDNIISDRPKLVNLVKEKILTNHG